MFSTFFNEIGNISVYSVPYNLFHAIGFFF
jgi:hypothetical protein